MSTNISKFETLSRNPKIVFLCRNCGFTDKTSGFPKSCPCCHFAPLEEINKEREKEREIEEILAMKFEEVKP